MRASPRKAVVTMVAALALVGALAPPAAAGSAEFTAVGTMTITTTPPLVFPIGQGELHPCRDPEERFTATTTGDATTGEVDVSLPPLFTPKPGTSNPVIYDELEITTLFDDLTYSRVGTTFDYAITGTVILQVDAWNVEQQEFPCDQTDHKCSYVLMLDADGSVLHNTSPDALPTISAGASVDLVATTNSPNGIELTYMSGDCEEYFAVSGHHLDLDLVLTRA
jgi:hypothetical protein